MRTMRRCYVHWNIWYRISDCVLTDNGTKFISMFFDHLCPFLQIKHLVTTEYHRQTNRNAERFNEIIKYIETFMCKR